MSHNPPFTFGSVQPPQLHSNMENIQSPQANGQAAMPSQQANGQQNAPMPNLDPNVLQTLQGIPPQQLLAFLQMLQSAAPQNAAQTPVPVAPLPTVPTVATVNQQPPQVVAQPQAPSQDVDMDKEEGELEEGEEADAAAGQGGFLQPPPTGPRKRSASPRDSFGRSLNKRASQGRNSPQTRDTSIHRTSGQLNGYVHSGKPVSSPSNGHTNGRRKVDSASAARAFVLQMHKAGYTFEQLAQEIPNTKALRRMYQALGLPLPTDRPQVTQQATVTPASAAQNQPTIAVEPRKASAPKRPAPAKPAPPQDRTEYLARLQAAKKGKAAAAAPPVNKPAEQPAPPPTAAIPANPTALSATTEAPAPINVQQAAEKDKVKVNNELLRERLAKIRAENAAKAQKSSNGTASSSPVVKTAAISSPPAAQAMSTTAPQSGLGAGLADIGRLVSQAAPAPMQSAPLAPSPLQPVQAPLYTTFSPTPPTPGRSFSALPGLFMASTPVQASPIAPPQMAAPPLAAVAAARMPAPPLFNNQPSANTANGQASIASPAASPAPLNVGRKRPVAADFDADVPATATRSAAKRPAFGESRSNSENERMIINVSDDEDEDEDEMDAEPTPVRSTSAQHHSRYPGSLPDFPPKPSFASGPGTPSTAYAAEEAERQKAIAALNAKIAKAEAAKSAREAAAKASKANGTVTVSKQVDSSAPTSGNNTPIPASTAPIAVNTAVSVTSKQASPQVSAGANGSSTTSERSMSATAIARQQERALLHSRLRELQAQAAARQKGTTVISSPATVQTELVMSGAVPNQEPVDNEESAVVSTEPAVKADEEDAMDVSSAEDGEVDEEVAQAAEDEDYDPSHLSVPADEGKVGSQATTATASSQVEDTAGTSTGVPNAAQTFVEAAHEVQNNLAPTLSNEDQPMDEDSSDEESDEDDDSDDLDIPPAQPVASVNGVVAERTAQAEEFSDEDGSSGDAGDEEVPVDQTMTKHEEDDEYEPEPVAVNPADDQVKEEDEEYEPEASATSEHHANGSRAITAVPDMGDTKMSPDESKPMAVDDDLAPELQPLKAQQVKIDDDQAFKTSGYYRPYESPLTKFKDYRYHPEYLSSVAGGYKSLTYSHHIDPVTPLCPHEAAGGVCNDKSCDNQHFRTMAYTDNDLLKALGTERTPVMSPEEKTKWNAGLGALVKELRSTKQGKDANAIAARIAQYRREFVKDPTKVLWLGDA